MRLAWARGEGVEHLVEVRGQGLEASCDERGREAAPKQVGPQPAETPLPIDTRVSSPVDLREAVDGGFFGRVRLCALEADPDQVPRDAADAEGQADALAAQSALQRASGKTLGKGLVVEEAGLREARERMLDGVGRVALARERSAQLARRLVAPRQA
jgi:hypothetical protein